MPVVRAVEMAPRASDVMASLTATKLSTNVARVLATTVLVSMNVECQMVMTRPVSVAMVYPTAADCLTLAVPVAAPRVCAYLAVCGRQHTPFHRHVSSDPCQCVACLSVCGA